MYLLCTIKYGKSDVCIKLARSCNENYEEVGKVLHKIALHVRGCLTIVLDKFAPIEIYGMWGITGIGT